MSEKFYLYMELSEDKMLRDGVDIEDCKNELDRVVLSHKGIKEGEGCYSFKTFMTREVASYVWGDADEILDQNEINNRRSRTCIPTKNGLKL